MINKKKIVAIILFVFLGLFVFTFANPSEDLKDDEQQQNEQVDNDKLKDEEVEKQIITPIVQTIDNAPIIKIDSNIVILLGDSYNVMTGVSVSDDNERLTASPSITDTTLLSVGRYTIVYTVKDKSNNVSYANRTLVVLDPDADNDNDNFTNKEEFVSNTNYDDHTDHPDTLEPVISLLGDDPIMIGLNDSYIEPGFDLIVDSHDKTTTKENIQIENTINPSISGEYRINYRVIDAFGKTTTVTRTVKVVDNTPAEVNVTYISNESQAIKYTKIGDRIAVRFITNEAIDTTNSIVKIAGQIATLEKNPKIPTKNEFEYVYSIKVNQNTKEGIVDFLLDIVDLNGNQTPTISFNDKDYGRYTAKIVVDITAPTISLNGDSKLILEAGIDTYIELNAVVEDSFDGTWEVEPVLIHYAKDGKFIGSVDSVDTTKLGTYKVVYKATDKSGNVAIDKNRSDHDYVMRTITVVDTTAPTVPLINTFGYESDTWTNKIVDLKAYGSTDNYTSKDDIKYQMRLNDDNWQDTDFASIASNYDVYVSFRAIDSEGNASQSTEKIHVLFNNTIGSIVVRKVVDDSTNITLTNNSTTAGTRFKIVSRDDIYHTIYVNGIKKNYVTGFDSKKGVYYGNTVIYDLTDGDYEIKLVDDALNETKFNFKVDNTAPTAVISYSNNNGLAVTKEDVLVTLTANETIKDLIGWNKMSDNVYTKIYSNNTKDKVEIEDLVGNKTVIDYEVKRIDKNNPIFSGIENLKKYNKEVTYGISKTGMIDGTDFTIIEGNISKIIIDGISYALKDAPRTISSQGEHTMRVIDKAGNEASINFFIDSINPIVTLDLNYTTLRDENNYYHNDAITITVNATDDNELLYSFGDESNYSINNEITRNWTSTNYNIYVKDSFGNVTVKTINLHIDKTPMTISYKTYDGSNFIDQNGGTFKALSDLYIQANNGWKLSFSKYLWSKESTGITLDNILEDGTDFSNNNEINIPTSDGTYYLWAYAKDYHGNELISVSEPFNIDNVAPIITINPYNTDFTNQNINVTATTNEGSLNFDSHMFTENGSFEFVATDLAGNVSKKNVVINNIDKINPELNISYTNEDIILFHSDYEEDAKQVKGLENLKFNFSYSDLSGIKVAKYALGNHDLSYFENNGNLITNNTIDKQDDTYTLYVEDNAGNKSITTKTVNNIYKGNDTAIVDNLKITVSGLEWGFGNYRNITVEALNGNEITGYGHISSDSQYLTDVVIDSNNYGSKKEWKLKRNYDDYHTVYIKDSTGKIYTVWIEINPYD